MWGVYKMPDLTFHVVPTVGKTDTVAPPHILSKSCVCNPRLEETLRNTFVHEEIN